MNYKVINAIAIAITVIWAINFMVFVIREDYDPPASINSAMLIVAGAAFTGAVVKKNGNGSKP